MEDKDPVLKVLGENIRKIRKAKNMVQVDLELASGIASSDISKIENGIINPAFTTLVKIATALQVQLNELYAIKKS